MNNTQRCVVGIGLSVFLALGLFPPWTVDRVMYDVVKFRWLFSPPNVITGNPFSDGIATIDYPKLFLAWVIVAVITGVIAVLSASAAPPAEVSKSEPEK